MAVKNSDVRLQGMTAPEAQVRDRPYRGKLARRAYQPGARIHTFDQRHVLDSKVKQGARTPAQSFAFSGRGFLPNLFASHAAVTLNEASATQLENEGVHGREGMMPPAGHLGRLQSGQRLDEGSGGAGSFATVPAFGAKVNG